MFKVGDRVRFDCASDAVRAWGKLEDGCEKKQSCGRKKNTRTTI